mmetsp:Transcript_3946/g.8702  ORF Transcript_3946/g.8702 Transcript_3946/m.8702 type:complete len:222 (-) Transcript_3946:713-1378(-)
MLSLSEIEVKLNLTKATCSSSFSTLSAPGTEYFAVDTALVTISTLSMVLEAVTDDVVGDGATISLWQSSWSKLIRSSSQWSFENGAMANSMNSLRTHGSLQRCLTSTKLQKQPSRSTSQAPKGGTRAPFLCPRHVAAHSSTVVTLKATNLSPFESGYSQDTHPEDVVVVAWGYPNIERSIFFSSSTFFSQGTTPLSSPSTTCTSPTTAVSSFFCTDTVECW